jgi:type IV secretory pathway TraG/TraD family ATPase VirD4
VSRVHPTWWRTLAVLVVMLVWAGFLWHAWTLTARQARSQMHTGWLEIVGEKNKTVPQFTLACALNDRCRPLLAAGVWQKTSLPLLGSSLAVLFALPFVWVLLSSRQRMLYDARWASLERLTRAGATFEDKDPALKGGLQIARAWAHYPSLQKNRHGYLRLPAWGDKPGPRGGKVIALTTSETKRELPHVLVVGPTRSGKGLMITHNLLTWTGNAIINDPKGEHHAQTSGYRASLGHRIRVIDPRGFGDRFDPFSALGSSLDGLRAAAEVILETDRERDPIFAQRASAALYAALCAARLEGQPVLPYLRSVTKGSIDGFVKTLRRIKDDQVTQGLTDFLDCSPYAFDNDRHDRFLLSAWGTMIAKLQPLFAVGVLKASSGNDFSVKDFLYEPTTLYLRFSETDIGFSGAYLKLVWLALANGLIEQSDALKEALPIKTLLVLDEARAVPMPNLGKYVSTIASRGLTAMVFVQELSQLASAYGEHDAAEIVSNCKAHLIYRTPNLETQRLVSERCGNTSVAQREQTRSKSGYLTTFRSKDRELIASDEVDRLHEQNVIAFVDNLPPILARRLSFFDEHPAWKRAQACRATEVKVIADLEIKLPKGSSTRPSDQDGVLEEPVMVAAKELVESAKTMKNTTKKVIDDEDSSPVSALVFRPKDRTR